MLNSEVKNFALYQMHADTAASHNDTGSWHLMRVDLITSNLSKGIHNLTDARIVGLASQIPADFESGHLVFSHRSESDQIISEVQSILGISADEITNALENNMIVVYSYSDP